MPYDNDWGLKLLLSMIQIPFKSYYKSNDSGFNWAQKYKM